jgi:DNA-3-methyladenine glycosylase I
MSDLVPIPIALFDRLAQACPDVDTILRRANLPRSRFNRAALRRMASTPASLALSQDLRGRGWTFVGPTTMYSFLQSLGIVNDHVDCAPGARVDRARRAVDRPR